MLKGIPEQLPINLTLPRTTVKIKPVHFCSFLLSAHVYLTVKKGRSMGNSEVQVMILKSPIIRTVALGLLTIVLVSSISSVAHSQLSPEQQETESKAELDKFASRLWDEGARIAFAEVDHNTLLKLRHHADLNVAAYAAWFGVVAASDVNMANGEQQQLEKARFFGYLSGRLNTPLPDWWLDALLEYDASMPRAVFYTGMPADFKQTLGI